MALLRLCFALIGLLLWGRFLVAIWYPGTPETLWLLPYIKPTLPLWDTIIGPLLWPGHALLWGVEKVLPQFEEAMSVRAIVAHTVFAIAQLPGVLEGPLAGTVGAWVRGVRPEDYSGVWHWGYPAAWAVWTVIDAACLSFLGGLGRQAKAVQHQLMLQQMSARLAEQEAQTERLLEHQHAQARKQQVDGVWQVIHDFKEEIHGLRSKVYRDPLTGLYNREYLLNKLDFWVEKAESLRTSVGILVVDLDHFKRINDGFGHMAGDVVLKAIGKLMQQVFPLSGKSMVAGRYGGEELVVLFFDMPHEEMLRLADLLRLQIAQLHFPAFSDLQVTASMGLYAAYLGRASHAVSLSPQGMFQWADKLCYESKAGGRNRLCHRVDGR